jgi:hypothetical protein
LHSAINRAEDYILSHFLFFFSFPGPLATDLAGELEGTVGTLSGAGQQLAGGQQILHRGCQISARKKGIENVLVVCQTAATQKEKAQPTATPLPYFSIFYLFIFFFFYFSHSLGAAHLMYASRARYSASMTCNR